MALSSHTPSTTSLLVLSLLALASSTSAFTAASSYGSVDALDILDSTTLETTFAAYDDELLPPPEVPDYENVDVWERSVDGQAANARWKSRRALKSNVDRSSVACTTTAQCTAALTSIVTNSHRLCKDEVCTYACNTGHVLSGKACVSTTSSSSTSAATAKSTVCSSTADCTSALTTIVTNSHRLCKDKFCTYACNTGHVLSGTACVSTASTTTTTAAAKTTTTASSASTSSAGLPKAWKGTSTFTRAGYTGVGAMQVALVDDDHLLIYDKAENNALLDASGDPAWSALYSISEKKVRALNVVTNSFCAGGGWISNGTMINIGGNPQQTYINDAAADGLAGIRMFTPCSDEKCDVYEDHDRIRLTSARWYPSTTRVTDGSLLIAGGMVAGGYNNAESTDNPTFEWFPPKNDGLQFYSTFLHDALNSNLYPIMYTLPSGYVFIAANKLAMLYDWKTNTERRIKSLPNGVTVTYPVSAASALLPLTVANNWTPEILFCGGTTADLDADPSTISATYPASSQCSRMVLDAAGIKAGWEVDTAPVPRTMSQAVIAPTGHVVIINGGQTGIAGYGNVLDEVGASNARAPAKTPTYYDPNAALGSRFNTDFPSAGYERLYHSTASLLPDGSIWIGGSNPNDGVSTTTYATRYQVEIFNPPYMTQTRPTYTGLPSNLLYGKSYTLTVGVPSGTTKVQAVVIDVGYSTHLVSMSQRYVELETTLSGKKLTITGPKNTGIYPPGPGWLYILADGVPSKGLKTMVGPGASPPVSETARRNMLAKTSDV